MKGKIIFFSALLLGFLQTAVAQTFNIMGRVTDQEGNALPGVTISEKGTTNSTQTDAEGKFNFKASAEGVLLTFSYIGFQPKEIAAAHTLTVVLEADVAQLDEIVVTGYATQKKGDVTASVVTVSADKLKDASNPNVGSLLQGKVSGVDVVAPTGRPGDNPNIRIRGRSSISSSVDPLWVVDGVIIHGVPNINPNDVETMTVLKDAAATTQYGSRGSNGVIVVTTKRAKEVGTSTLTANLKTGVSYFNHGNFKLMNSQQLYDTFQQFGEDTGITDDVLKTDYDWVKNGTQAGPLNDLSLTYLGRTDKVTIYAGGNYYKEKGTVKGYTFDRWAGRLNLDYEVNKKLTLRPKLNATFTSNDDRQHSIYEMYLNMPWDSPYDAEGNVINAQKAALWYGRDYSNYLYDLQYNYGKSDIFDFQFNGDFDYKFSDHFTFVSTNNIAYYNSTGMSYVDPKSISGQSTEGSVSGDAARRIVRFTNQMLKYNQSFGKHTVGAFAAYEYMDYVYKDISATGNGIVPGSEILGNAATAGDFGGGKNDYAAQSAILNATYSYDSRYNFQGSYRYDGSSRFGSDRQYGNFYAFSAAWNIHEEDFFQVDKINYLRLRTSYGKVGNVPNVYYGSYDLFKLDAQYNGLPAAYPDQLNNMRLTWETSKDVNIGFELGLFNRLDFTLDLYNKNTDGLLHFVQLPVTSGYSGYYDNIGAVRNQGIEFSVGANIFNADNPFQWRVDFNIAKNNNKITALADHKDQLAGNKQYSEGRDIDSWYMRKWMGVDPANGDPLWEVIDPATGEKSTTNNYNSATLQFVGTSTPDFTGGFSSSMEYKDFFLTASFAFNKGAYAYNSGRELFDSDGAYPYYNQIVLQNGWSRWSEDNPDATHPRLVYNGGTNSNKTSSRYLEDASFLRMRNVTFGYRAPQKFAAKLGLKAIDAYVSGDNLWISTKFSGVDPESALYPAVKNSGNDNVDGDATSTYPSPRRFTFGVNVSF